MPDEETGFELATIIRDMGDNKIEVQIEKNNKTMITDESQKVNGHKFSLYLLSLIFFRHKIYTIYVA